MPFLPVLRQFALFICLALPWLNPFASGPSAIILPWLVSLASTVLVLQLAHQARKHFLIAIFLIAVCALFIRVSISFILSNATETLAAALVLCCVVAMAWVGTALQVRERAFGVRALAHIWLAVAVLSVLMALCQYLRIADWFAPWISHSGDGTAYANVRQRNQFATLCAMGLLALLYLRQTASLSAGVAKDVVHLPVRSARNEMELELERGEGQSQPAQGRASFAIQIWPWVAVAVLASGTALSSSRTGALQWLLIAAAVWCWRGSLRAGVQRFAYGALVVYAVAVALMPRFADLVGNASTGLWGRAQEGVGQGLAGNSRVWLYSNVLELIAQKPWLGWGWRELAFAHYSTHFDTRFVELLDNAHNLPLHVAVELGVPFALLFCGTILWWVIKAAPWRETDSSRQLAWGVLMLIGVHSTVEYPLWYGPFVMTVGLCIGLLQRIPSTPPVFAPNQSEVILKYAQSAIKYIATALLAFTAYAAYDYHRISQIYLLPEERSTLYTGDALALAQKSWLFQKHARFAELVITPVTRESAPRVHALAQEMIHFSPEPRVIEALIESATLLGRDDEAVFHLSRYKEVYPKDHAAWSALK